MLLIIDNYDSFTYNLVQRLGELDPAIDLKVVRNDQATLDEIATWKPNGLIISPGPCTPDEAGISVSCIRRFAGEFPILGVCLGHQSMAQAFGAKIVRAPRLMHGKTDDIHHDGLGLFRGLPNPFVATRYHSLVVEPSTLPAEFCISAWSTSPNFGREIMGIRHRQLPLEGLQFHPESFLTTSGPGILCAFATLCGLSVPTTGMST
jgi:anthranilate synthase component 2